MGYSIEFKNVSKIYKGSKENKAALKNVSFSLMENKIYGLIGSNGAGKTTLLKLIANSLFSTEGQITINDTTFMDNSNIHQDICFMPDYHPLFDSYTLKTLFEIASSFYPNWDHNYAQKLIDDFSLKPTKKYSKMSKGEKGKVNIMIALASRSKITIFDETYISLDSPSRKKFFDLLVEDYIENPRTVIISTHYIDEVSKLFEDIILIDEGKLLVHECKDHLEEKSLTILGAPNLGEQLLKGVNIIHKESFGGMCAFSIYDTLSEKQRKQLKDHDFKISITPVEKWFLHMLSKEVVQ